MPAPGNDPPPRKDTKEKLLWIRGVVCRGTHASERTQQETLCLPPMVCSSYIKGSGHSFALCPSQKHVSQPASLLHGNSYLQVVQKVLKCDVTLLSINNSDWSQKGMLYFCLITLDV